MKNIGLQITRVIVGLLFIFSGLIKANDPMGFGYKLQEYFEVFHIAFLHDYATAIAILLCTLEIILGALLLLGLWSARVAWGLLLIIIFFTFLTFYSAFFKVVTSCGCFGDAIPLTPWQSFSKDLVLLAMILLIFIKREQIHPLIRKESAQKLVAVLVVLASLGFGLYTTNFLPVLDFLPYKVGNNIPQLMIVPPGAPQDEYEITYTLKNKQSAETKKMTDKEYLKTEIWKDKNWEIVGEPESKLIKKGFDLKIKDLKITDSQGTDYNAELLENPFYNLVIVAYDLSNADQQAIGDLNALAINAAENFNIRTVFLTSNSVQDAELFSKKNKLVMEVFFADAIPLKSMVRSNPGLMLLKGGNVINKWHYNNLPSYERLTSEYFNK
ncbi:BT_3928 family protein [Daejeonella sp. H1SJ63]|uniref:BT_3928 family protein n=1 Tax=Daejeonella sp. H1SJ63 TaxID=3034145 RepID=UPI0023EE14E2|nr:BT_3928 family protein [Daejeonella sp. H1SJ63]